MEEKIKVLRILSDNSSLNQRELAEMVGISLGKVNNILKDCVEENLISRNIDSKENRYKVTDKGFMILEENLKGMKEIKLNINDESYYHIKEAVILAAGGRKEFDSPTGALNIEDTSVLQRSISILKENGITKIVVVTGYKEEVIKELLQSDSSLIFVNNDRYKWTGTMSSLALVKEYIEEDFILLESDLVYERRTIKEIINNKRRDCLLITNESGSGDEAFVQLKDGYLFKMAKDIHQFNRIDGEMIGISKISYKLFNMMLKEYESNINPYLNYEYILLDVARDYKVSCIKIDDLAWGEIDNLQQYNRIKNYLYPKIKRRELQLEKENIKRLIQECLNLNYEDIQEVLIAGGMTNKNYKVRIKDEYYILRLPGAGTENMISRKNEMINSKLASDMGLDVEILFFNSDSGIKIAKFINGAETINSRTAKKEENMILISDALRKLHKSNMKMGNTFDVFKEIERYEDIMTKNNVKFFEDYFEVRPRVIKLKELMIQHGFNLVPSHNDTVPENFIKDNNGRLYLIDWEYSGLNDEMWDLAAHSLECDFSENDEELFSKYYFQGKVQLKDKLRILMNQICQDFLWSVWTLIKEAEGDDFGSYGIDRYNRAKSNLKKLESLI